MKTIITAMPVYKFIEANSFESYIHMIDALRQKYNVRQALIHTIDVCGGRNALADFVVKGGHDDEDYVLWLDSDHIYSADSALRLVDQMESNGLEMVSAMYKQRPGRNLAHVRINGRVVERIPYDPETHGLQDVDVVGFGFLLMKVGLLKRIVDRYTPAFQWVRAEDGIHGEDAYFCSLLKKEGVRICYDADVHVKHLQGTMI
ncbi:MAG: hypothetical protein KGL39_32530 [Patescibacteria group bacterium]|nr:hypothetical protein [Patescibacteria group bacterium]